MVAHFPSASVSALGDLSDTSAEFPFSGWPGRLSIWRVETCLAGMSWRSHWRCGAAICPREPSGSMRLGGDRLESESPTVLACELNGVDLAVAELESAPSGAEAPWTRSSRVRSEISADLTSHVDESHKKCLLVNDKGSRLCRG
jgi:hypothetical protein